MAVSAVVACPPTTGDPVCKNGDLVCIGGKSAPDNCIGLYVSGAAFLFRRVIKGVLLTGAKKQQSAKNNARVLILTIFFIALCCFFIGFRIGLCIIENDLVYNEEHHH